MTWCELPASTPANPGALCVRQRGHAGPGIFCTSDLLSADARDHYDAIEAS